MDPGTKCHFYIDGTSVHTYFYYKDHAGSTDSDGEYRDQRNSDGIIVHYLPAESEVAKSDV
jgi:hypothetical protein